MKRKKENKLKAAIIGCGRIASLFAADRKRKGVVTHAQAYLNHSGFELVAASDLNPERLEEFGSRWNLKNLYADYREMLRREQPDVVSVCTPTHTHFEICVAAIKKGVRGIFCEKPMTGSLKDADALESLAKKSGISLAVNHSRRWDVFEQKAAAYIREGKLGELQTMDAYYTAGIANSGSHLIDLILMLSGQKAISVTALSEPINPKAPDPTLDVQLKFANGRNCFLHGLEVSSFLMFEVDIYGTKGRLRIKDSGFNAKLWRAQPHKEFSGYFQLIEEKHPFGPGYQSVLENAVDNLYHAVRSGKPVQSGTREGKAVVEIIIAVHESLKRGGKEIRLPLKNRNLSL